MGQLHRYYQGAFSEATQWSVHHATMWTEENPIIFCREITRDFLPKTNVLF